MGKIFRLIPLIVIPCLLFSLVESLFILPAHPVPHQHAGHIRMAAVSGALRQRAQALHPAGLRADPGGRAALAVFNRRHRGVHADRDRRDGARRPAELSLLPLDGGRCHRGVDHHAAGHAGQRHLGRDREARGGRGPAPRAAAGRNRPGLFPARGGLDRRPAPGVAGRWGGGLAPT